MNDRGPRPARTVATATKEHDTEHPDTEHPDTEHPDTEHPDTEHPDADHRTPATGRRVANYRLPVFSPLIERIHP